MSVGYAQKGPENKYENFFYGVLSQGRMLLLNGGRSGLFFFSALQMTKVFGFFIVSILYKIKVEKRHYMTILLSFNLSSDRNKKNL